MWWRILSDYGEFYFLLLSEWVIARFLSLVAVAVDWFSKKSQDDLKVGTQNIPEYIFGRWQRSFANKSSQ